MELIEVSGWVFMDGNFIKRFLDYRPWELIKFGHSRQAFKLDQHRHKEIELI